MQGFLSVPRLVHLSVYICKSVAGYCLSVRSHWFLSPLVTSRLYGTFAGVWGRVGRRGIWGGGGSFGATTGGSEMGMFVTLLKERKESKTSTGGGE